MKEISLTLTYPRGSAFIVIWMLAMVSVSGKDIARRAVMEEVPMTAVRVQDTFWSARMLDYGDPCRRTSVDAGRCQLV